MNTPCTPGPWTVDHLGQIIGPRDGCSHEIIAHMPVWFPVAPPGKHATQDHIAANAQLIAAAPDLLEALEACLNFWDAPRPTFGLNQQRKAELDTIQAQARAAIAKATGGDK